MGQKVIVRPIDKEEGDVLQYQLLMFLSKLLLTDNIVTSML